MLLNCTRTYIYCWHCRPYVCWCFCRNQLTHFFTQMNVVQQKRRLKMRARRHKRTVLVSHYIHCFTYFTSASSVWRQLTNPVGLVVVEGIDCHRRRHPRDGPQEKHIVLLSMKSSQSLQCLTITVVTMPYSHSRYTALQSQSLHCLTVTVVTMSYTHGRYTVLQSWSLQCLTVTVVTLPYSHGRYTALQSRSLTLPYSHAR